MDLLTIAVIAGIGYAIALAFILGACILSGRRDDLDQQIADQIAHGDAPHIADMVFSEHDRGNNR